MVFITDISIDSFMLKSGYIIFILLIIISCNNFTTKKEKELIIGNRTLYILSESTSISGSGSFKIVLSNDKKIDIRDLDLTSNYIIFYKIFNNRLVLYSNKKLIVPKVFNSQFRHLKSATTVIPTLAKVYHQYRYFIPKIKFLY